MVRVFDETFIAETGRRFTSLPRDKKPIWGRMSPPQMLAHITHMVRYSLGKEPVTPDEGGWFYHHVVAPLIFWGIVKFPKNVKSPKTYERQAPESDVSTLVAELSEFLTRYRTPGFDPPPHPFFGKISNDWWAKLHVMHVDHHARQFGV